MNASSRGANVRLTAYTESLKAVNSVLECVNIPLLRGTSVSKEHAAARRLLNTISTAVDELEDLRDGLAEKVEQTKPLAQRETDRLMAEEQAEYMEAVR
jgi:hypothetical protein